MDKNIDEEFEQVYQLYYGKEANINVDEEYEKLVEETLEDTRINAVSTPDSDVFNDSFYVKGAGEEKQRRMPGIFHQKAVEPEILHSLNNNKIEPISVEIPVSKVKNTSITRPELKNDTVLIRNNDIKNNNAVNSNLNKDCNVVDLVGIPDPKEQLKINDSNPADAKATAVKTSLYPEDKNCWLPPAMREAKRKETTIDASSESNVTIDKEKIDEDNSNNATNSNNGNRADITEVKNVLSSAEKNPSLKTFKIVSNPNLGSLPKSTRLSLDETVRRRTTPEPEEGSEKNSGQPILLPLLGPKSFRNLNLKTITSQGSRSSKLSQLTRPNRISFDECIDYAKKALGSPLSDLNTSSNTYQSVYAGRLQRSNTIESIVTTPETPIKDIAGHLEITHPEENEAAALNLEPAPLPRAPENSNFVDGVGFSQSQVDEEIFNLPEISDASKRITKSKSKKKNNRSKIPQRQDSKESKSSREHEGGEKDIAAEDVVWDFDVKEERLHQEGCNSTANGKCKEESGDSGSESDSRGSPRRLPVLNSPGKRTIASSSGSDVALHEGAELSPDDNTDVVGSDGLRQSMQNILDQFMNEERRYDNQ